MNVSHTLAIITMMVSAKKANAKNIAHPFLHP